jgi:hypothetical protein
VTIQQAYEREITALGRTTWGRAAWLELRVVRGLLSMTAMVHMNYMASRETPLHQLPHDGWERWTHHTEPDQTSATSQPMPAQSSLTSQSYPPQADKPSHPLPVPPSPC